MSLKYAILVGDGMADFPIPELGNITPLAYANTPNMDFIAKNGQTGLVSTVPYGMHPGSDVANLSLLGYDPLKYYSGRAPIEAASMGIRLSDQDTAFRCNLVTIEENTMKDYSAGHIDSNTADKIISLLQKQLGTSSLHFHPGISYRHILVISDFPNGVITTPPHDITDQNISFYIPSGNGSDFLNDLMKKSHKIISNMNSERNRATDIWLWGQGKSLKLPTIKDQFGIDGSVISAVDLVRGIGVLAGLEVRIVDGATGYLGTNYAGKISEAFKAFETQDLVYLHVEAPDETSHEGSLNKKIQAIEEFDTNIVGEMLKYHKENNNIQILIAPDHATPVSLKTHSSEAVPYAIWGSKFTKDSSEKYSETQVTQKQLFSGSELFRYFIN